MSEGVQKKKKVTHRDVCRAVGKIRAYLKCSDMDNARLWAHTLVDYMVTMGIYPAHCARKREGMDEKNA